MTTREISIKGQKLRILTFADELERLISGATTGDTGTAPIFKVKGTYIYWIDDDGNERRAEGSVTGNTGTVGIVKVKGELLYFNDDDGNERWLRAIWSIDSLNNGYPYLGDNPPSS